MKTRYVVLVATSIAMMLWMFTGYASADMYTFYTSNQAHTDELYNGNADPNGTSPYPLRFWSPAPYNTQSTWYKLGSTLTASFKTAIRNADNNWDIGVWESGTQYMHFYEDTSAITDPYNRAYGMSVLPPGYLGLTYWRTDLSWHPIENTRKGWLGHSLKQWYVRFQSDAGRMAPLAWETGDAAGIADRESVATHEMGHTVVLGHPTTLDDSPSGLDWQTMWGSPMYSNKTGIFMQTPARYDEWGEERLYPGY